MTALEILGHGLKRARRHLRLTVVLYLPALLGGLTMAAVARSVFGPAFDSSLFAADVLGGDWFAPWIDFTASSPGIAGVLVGPVLAVLLGAVALAQVAVSAGVVGTLVEQDALHPFLLGIRRNLGRFLRAAAVYLAGLVPIAVVAGATAKWLFDLAGERQDGRLDLVGVAAAAAVGFLLWAPWDLAYDLARVSAVRHQQGSMAVGLVRALGDVLRRPAVLLPLAAAAVALPLALHLLYGLLRSPWTPSTGAAVALLVGAQQLVMLARSGLRLWLWGAAVEVHDHLGGPAWCRPIRRPRPAAPLPTEVEPGDETPHAVEALA